MAPEWELILNKCAAAVVVVISGVVGAVVPFIVTRRDRSAKYIVMFESLAAGTLLGLAVFHLFLEAAHKLEEVGFGYYIGSSWHNPAQTFVFVGFLIVLILEHIPGFEHSHAHKPATTDAGDATHDYLEAQSVSSGGSVDLQRAGYGTPLLYGTGAVPVAVGTGTEKGCDSNSCVARENSGAAVDHNVAAVRGDNSIIANGVKGLPTGAAPDGDSVRVELAHVGHHGHQQELPISGSKISCIACTATESGKGKSPSTSSSQRLESLPSSPSVNSRGWCCGKLNVNARTVSSLVALLLHSLFEGMLIGIADTASEVWIITLGVISHKWAEAFSLSCQYIQYNMSTKSVIIHHAIFCTMQPVAVFIGIAIQTENETAAGIFVSLACGTILYIATSSLFSNMSSPVIKGVWQSKHMPRLLFFAMGGMLMGAASLIPAPH